MCKIANIKSIDACAKDYSAYGHTRAHIDKNLEALHCRRMRHEIRDTQSSQIATGDWREVKNRNMGFKGDTLIRVQQVLPLQLQLRFACKLKQFFLAKISEKCEMTATTDELHFRV